jgi:COP9 signalosome complex subunit 4
LVCFQCWPRVNPAAAHFALEKIQPRVVAFEEQVSVIRVNLAKLYEGEEEWKEAAKILIAIPLDTGQR